MNPESGALSDEPDEVETVCTFTWGFHDEHWCEEDASHPLGQHFCLCGEERDLDPVAAEEDAGDG